MTVVDPTSHDQLEKRLADIDWGTLLQRSFTSSPESWADQVIYFLMLDRFSDGLEHGYRDANGDPISTGETPRYTGSLDNAWAWGDDVGTAARGWCGGTLRGLRSKLGYLKRLGITALWVSPVLRQVGYELDVGNKPYHGYAAQNFLDVDPHFGTRQELRELVDEAHALGIRIILDVVFNHAGPVFEYDLEQASPFAREQGWVCWEEGQESVPALGLRDRAGKPRLPFGDLTAIPEAWPDAGIWPAELQTSSAFHRRGGMKSFVHRPEYLTGDTPCMRDFNLGYAQGEESLEAPLPPFVPSAALKHLCQIYKFWMAYADLDGLRLDTVKHMELGASRYLASVLHEFAISLGKRNFYLIGEVAGGREQAYHTMELCGLDAVLGVEDTALNLGKLARGQVSAQAYFDLFANSDEVRKGTHAWFGSHVVTCLDDHDMLWAGEDHKARFCAEGGRRHLSAALALNLLTLGIPCLYYGTEQLFNGAGKDYNLRECMFGGAFGAFGSQLQHFFQEEGACYRYIRDLCDLRAQHPALRQGRQYLRMISASGVPGTFGFPAPQAIEPMRALVSWSRIFNDVELLLVVNTDPDAWQTAHILLTEGPLTRKTSIARRYAVGNDAQGLPTWGNATELAPLEPVGGGSFSVRLSLPPGGFALYA